MTDQTPTPEPAGRRTAARRRFSPTALLAVLLPLLTVGALALVQPEAEVAVGQAAEEVPVVQADLVCPPALAADAELAVAPAGELDDGTAEIDDGNGEPSDVELRSDAVTPLTGRDDAAFVRAQGAVAAQLLASRFQPEGLAATECPVPRPTSWFTGVGADADHASVLELANPDAGPAVADVTVLGRNGPIDVPELRGLTVQGGRTVSVDLAQAVPTRSELTIQVVVSRGRLGATMADEVPELGTREATRDWLPSTVEPVTEQLLLGLVGGEGEDTLTLANPGEDEARVEVRIVTADASFVPEGQEEIAVAPGTVETVTLTDQLRRQIPDGALGLQVTSSTPVTSGLSSVVEDDLVHAAPVVAVGAPMTALVPPGESSVRLAGAAGAGVVVVESFDDGRSLGEERLELTEGSGGAIDLPEGTSLVRITPRRTSVAASVVTTGNGATVVPVGDLVRTALVPSVRPGLG
ncbi:DUF5719 family protein [Nocardioides euryhalodurans]|uniref:Secreted protein n=1 Tax=Nocardioides euryhalodurans TaxID=2518370 RepID=A0A4V1BDQ8_9ACTN|nr:DUF5719 family protein [Nocardioides euryhalodurans]QBR91972.1 hypothetical protein EXE57_06540 [Nocardioides euryhalodurans]